MVLNALKTKSMLFTSNRLKHKDTNLSLCHQDKSIEAVTSYKYLGVVFDKHISWKNHAEYVCNKVAGRIGVFSRIRRFITIEAAQTVYTSIIQPIFDYCSIAWSSLLQQDKDRMQRLQNRAARIIICETPAKSSSEVLKQLNWMTLDQRRAWNKVNLVRKCTLSQTPNYLSNSFARQNSNHSYSTRNNDFLILPKVRTNYGKRTFLFSGAGLFNSLPPKIRNVDNKDFASLSQEFLKSE